MSDNPGTKQQKENTPRAEQLEAGKKWLQLVAQARTDKTLKQRLMDTPIVVLREHGINVRQGLDVRVVENTDKVAYLMLPSSAVELTNEQLDAVSGGSISTIMEGSSSLYQALQSAVAFMVNCNIDGNPCTPSAGTLGGGK
jgi:hypothetical protein